MFASYPNRFRRLTLGAVVIAWGVGLVPGARAAVPDSITSRQAGFTEAPLATWQARAELPFLPAASAGERFAVSNLTRTYDRDFSHLLNIEAARRHADLALLDRYGSAPAYVPVEVDSSKIRLVDGNHPPEITEREKKQLEPPSPPVKVAIPSAVASTASIIGGFALLVKLIAEMIK